MSSSRVRVCLIIPPSLFLADERVFMPLGVLRVAASLEAKGVQVEVLDLSGVINFEEASYLHSKNSSANYFGITSTTPQFPAAKKVAAAIRSAKPEARIILGGPHATLVNSSKKQAVLLKKSSRASYAFRQLFELFDVVVAGDGELAIFSALADNPERLIDADDKRSELFLSSNEITNTPFPARHLLDVNSYNFRFDNRRGLSLIAQLGCPFECNFCSGRSSPTFRKVRYRGIENVVAEVKHLFLSYGVSAFMFYDDELNISPTMSELMYSLTDLQMQLGVEFRFRGCIKAELFSENQAKAMYSAGFREILVGFESGSDEILLNINKKATVDNNTRCIELATKFGIATKALMSVGHPGESWETINQTYRWLLEVNPTNFDVSILTVLPGTRYYDYSIQMEETKPIWTYVSPKTADRLHSIEIDFAEIMDYYKGNCDYKYQSFVFTDFLTREELVQARDWLERDIRDKLKIPYPQTGASILYDHSMGQINLGARQVLTPK